MTKLSISLTPGRAKEFLDLKSSADRRKRWSIRLVGAASILLIPGIVGTVLSLKYGPAWCAILGPGICGILVFSAWLLMQEAHDYLETIAAHALIQAEAVIETAASEKLPAAAVQSAEPAMEPAETAVLADDSPD